MRSSDRAAFDSLMDKLSRHFPERDVTPELRRDYWDALGRVEFGTVRRYADIHIANEKFFPRASQLQPQFKGKKPDVEDAARAHDEHADKDSAYSWDKYFEVDAEEAALKLRVAKSLRIIATTHPSHPAHAEALREDWQAQTALYELWRRRRVA